MRLSLPLSLSQSLGYAADKIQGELMGQLVESMTHQCFKLCLKSPSDHLTREQEKCLKNCNEKFLESRQQVAQQFGQLQQQQQQHRR